MGSHKKDRKIEVWLDGKTQMTPRSWRRTREGKVVSMTKTHVHMHESVTAKFVMYD